MARPRVFVSSTYYDLKYIRASLENFIDSLGYEAILSEKGSIAYTPDAPLDESCYREVRNADIFVLIIGGRYGTEKSESKGDLPREFFDKYDSITKTEYLNAVEKDIPVYILIDKAVYAEYQTYQRNKDNKDITYAHVDSVNIFALIEEILAKRRNNPMQTFDRYAEMEAWLRDQWAGLFRDLLTRMSSQKQIASLASQVALLTEINKTLQKYLEKVVSSVGPAVESRELIESEQERLGEAEAINALVNTSMGETLICDLGVPAESVLKAVREAESLREFTERIYESLPPAFRKHFSGEVHKISSPGFNTLRAALKLAPVASIW